MLNILIEKYRSSTARWRINENNSNVQNVGRLNNFNEFQMFPHWYGRRINIMVLCNLLGGGEIVTSWASSHKNMICCPHNIIIAWIVWSIQPGYLLILPTKSRFGQNWYQLPSWVVHHKCNDHHKISKWHWRMNRNGTIPFRFPWFMPYNKTGFHALHIQRISRILSHQPNTL